MEECNLPLSRASGFFGEIRFGAPRKRPWTIGIVVVVMHWMSPERGDRYTPSPEAAEAPDNSGVPVSPDDLAAQLSERYWERIRLFAARRIRDRAQAEDVAQEVIRRALEALRAKRIENLDALPAFLFQTARNVCMQWGRSEGRKARAFARLRGGAEDETNEDTLADLITEERRGKVLEALEQLGPGDREVLRLSYAETLGAEEITSRLHLTAGAVRVRRHRALNRLAELLDVTDRSGREL